MIQACNPPDTYWALALPFKLAGRKFVFDQHDLCPEVYESRFPNGSRALLAGSACSSGRPTRVADHVISTNDSYRDTAIRRGGVAASDVTVVRTGPDPDRLRRGEPNPDWRRGRRYLCAYLGVMGPQDGVDLALRAAAELGACGPGRHPVRPDGQRGQHRGAGRAREQLGIADMVTFTGGSRTRSCPRCSRPPISGCARTRSTR